MQLQVSDSQLLTPKSTIKAVYLLTLRSLQSEILDYQPGDWLTVQARNPENLVEQIMQLLGLNGDEKVTLRRQGEISAQQALNCYLEITQLNPAILNKMQRQLKIGTWQGRQEMMDYAFGRDIVDLLLEFPQMAQLGVEFLQWLSPLAPRYYSIASANNQTVDIMFKALRYHFAGRDKRGVASNYLADLKQGDLIEAEFKANPTFKLPDDGDTPIIMAGAGTGLAPFLGFMERRVEQQATDNLLFFGETEKANACLSCQQLLEWERSGDLTLSLTFSRDQADKRYVQDAMAEQKALLWHKWQQGAVLYICGSQKHLAPAIEALWQGMFCENLAMDSVQAEQHWHQCRKAKQIQMDVY